MLLANFLLRKVNNLLRTIILILIMVDCFVWASGMHWIFQLLITAAVLVGCFTLLFINGVNTPPKSLLKKDLSDSKVNGNEIEWGGGWW